MTDVIKTAPTFLSSHEVQFVRAMAVSRTELWSALSEKTYLDQWFMETEINLTQNGEYSFKDGWEGWEGWIGELVTGSVIRFDSSDLSYTRFEIAGEDGQLTLTMQDRIRPDLNMGTSEPGELYQPGGPGTHWAGLLAGWHDFLDALEALLSGRPLEDHFESLVSYYSDFLRNHFAKQNSWC